MARACREKIFFKYQELVRLPTEDLQFEFNQILLQKVMLSQLNRTEVQLFHLIATKPLEILFTYFLDPHLLSDVETASVAYK